MKKIVIFLGHCFTR